MIETTVYDSAPFREVADSSGYAGIGPVTVDTNYATVPESTLTQLKSALAEYPRDAALLWAHTQSVESARTVAWDCPAVTDAQRSIMETLDTFIAWKLVSHYLAQGENALWTPAANIRLVCERGNLNYVEFEGFAGEIEEFGGAEAQIARDLRSHVDASGPQEVAGIQWNSPLLTVLLGKNPTRDAHTAELFDRMQSQTRGLMESLLVHGGYFLPAALDYLPPVPVFISAITDAEAVYDVDSPAKFTVQEGTFTLLHSDSR